MVCTDIILEILINDINNRKYAIAFFFLRFAVLFSKYNAIFLSVFDATRKYHEKLRCLAVVRKYRYIINVCDVLSFHMYVKEKRKINSRLYNCF